MYSPDGKAVSYQTRPYNSRRDKTGKVIKCETPGGAELIANVHPSNKERIRDIMVSLHIAEGVKTADAMTSRGLCVVALTGVRNFGPRKCENMLPCFDHIPSRDETSGSSMTRTL